MATKQFKAPAEQNEWRKFWTRRIKFAVLNNANFEASDSINFVLTLCSL